MALDIAATTDRFEAVIPALREEAAAGEAARQLTDGAHAALVSSGVFDLFRPRAMGGEEADLLSMIRAVRTLARGDGSAGWCAMLSGAYATFGGLLPRAGAEEVFDGPATILAGQLAPGGQAQRVDGGYRVSGRWPFGSNCHHAQWLVGGTIVVEDGVPVMTQGGGPLIKLAVFRKSEATVFDTWRATGLRATGSHDYGCEDVFVPEQRTFWFSDEAHEPGPLYRLPTVAAFGTAIAAVNLGIADHALDLLAQIAPSKKPVLSPWTLQQKPSVHDRVGVALATYEAGAAYLEQAAAEAWAIAEAGRRPTFAERGRLWLAATHASQCALQAVEAVYTLAGSTSVYEENGIDRCLRDARTAAQHVMTQVLNYEIAGKQRLGLSVEDSTWALDRRPGDPA
jgi:alkylation response protein AidB-like acyl-CoA dehydrogenase